MMMLPRCLAPLARAVPRTPAATAFRSTALVRSVRPLVARSAYHSSAPSNDAAITPNQTQRQSRNQGVSIENASVSQEDDATTLGSGAHGKQDGFQDTKIADVLRTKAKYGDALHTVKTSDSVAVALQAMNHFEIGAILVTSADDPQSIVGIFSTRDFIKKVDDSWKPVDVQSTRVQDIMSHDPVFTYSDQSALAAMNMMNNGGFRHLPVRDRGSDRTIGLISIGDLVRTMMRDYQQKSAYLEEMVSGRYPA